MCFTMALYTGARRVRVPPPGTSTRKPSGFFRLAHLRQSHRPRPAPPCGRQGLNYRRGPATYVPFATRTGATSNDLQLAPARWFGIAEVLSTRLSGLRRRNWAIRSARFSEASRAVLVCKWFHGGYLAKVLAKGMRVGLFGKVEFDSYAGESPSCTRFESSGGR